MDIPLESLIECYRYPHMKVYQNANDFEAATLEALESLEDAQNRSEDAKRAITEVMSQLPDEDALDEIVDELHYALKQNKPEMKAHIKKALELLDTKGVKFCGAAEFAADVVKNFKE